MSDFLCADLPFELPSDFLLDTSLDLPLLESNDNHSWLDDILDNIGNICLESVENIDDDNIYLEESDEEEEDLPPPKIYKPIPKKKEEKAENTPKQPEGIPPPVYNPNLSVGENALVYRQRVHNFTRNGYIFTSIHHLFANDIDTEDVAVRVYDECNKRGMYYFQSAKLDYNEVDGTWVQRKKYRDDDSLISADVAVIDKLKVYTMSQYTINVSHQHSFFGIEDTQDKSFKGNKGVRGENAPNMFIREVVKSNSPAGTMVRYKRTVKHNVPHGHGIIKDANVNRLNVNMSRGYHDFVVVMNMVSTHVTFLNRESSISYSLDPVCGNNNSLTADSVINAVRNSSTFKHHAVAGKTAFNLTSKATFDTHKAVESYDEPDEELFIGSYHKTKPIHFYSAEEKEEWWRCLKPLFGIELQIHEHSMNCSAVRGSKLVPIICKKGAELLDDRNGKFIDVSLLVSNCKTGMEVISQSLVWSSLMLFCEIMGRRLGVDTMNRKGEYEIFRKQAVPAMEKIMLSRDNYAQATSFCQQIIRSTRMYTMCELKIVSHKFKVPEINTLFLEPVIPKYTAGSLRKRSLTFNNVPGTKKKKPKLVLGTTRNESISVLLLSGPAVFRSRFDL